MNVGLPSQWLIDVRVESLDQSLKRCAELCGRVVREPRGLGEERFAVIQDPVGAYMALVGE
jgi:predicted enzyme related to lactoylglutathione lyase